MGAAPQRWSRFAIGLVESTAGQPLCLSLCNTRHWRDSTAPREVLTGYAEVVQWAVAKAIYAAIEGNALAHEAAAHPHVASAELRRVVALREALAATFGAHAHRAVPDPVAVGEVEANFREALAHLALRIDGGYLVPSLPPEREGLEIPRWQVALSAISLLTSPAIGRVKQCEDDRGCGWLFLDTTRNDSRRYCFSRECGNRARQMRFRARHKDHAPAPAPG